MNIICKNINDFCTMITTCSNNSIKDVRLFISETDCYKPGLRASNTPKDYKRFTYICLTPLYTAIYMDNVKNTDYEGIYKTLEKCQENCNHDFYIQIFDELFFNSDTGCLSINNEINVI